MLGQICYKQLNIKLGKIYKSKISTCICCKRCRKRKEKSCVKMCVASVWIINTTLDLYENNYVFADCQIINLNKSYLI